MQQATDHAHAPTFPVGESGPPRGRTLTAGEIDLLEWLTYPPAVPGPLTVLLDDGRTPALSPALVLPVALCLGAASPLYTTLQSRGFHIVAALSHSVHVHSAVVAGDTLTVISGTTSARRSQGNSARFVVGIRDDCRNQRDEQVAEIERTVLFEYRRPVEPVANSGSPSH